MYAVQINIVNLDRNAIEFAQGWYVDAVDRAGALVGALAHLDGSDLGIELASMKSSDWDDPRAGIDAGPRILMPGEDLPPWE
jgi:hypothetical protein